MLDFLHVLSLGFSLPRGLMIFGLMCLYGRLPFASGLLDEGQNLDIRVGDRTWRQAFCYLEICLRAFVWGFYFGS